MAYYNEVDYIEKKDINAITDLISDRSEYEKIKEDEYRKYRDVIPMYDEYIDLLAKFIRKLPIEKNEISYSIVLDFLIHNGCLSKDGFFIFQKYSIRELRMAQGINVITGAGCCRNTSEFHERLFSKMNLNGKQTYVNSFSNSTDNFKNNYITHVANEITYENNIYLYDIINESLFKFNTEYELVDVSSQRGYYYFKPYGDIIFKSKDFYEMEKRLLEYKKMNKNNPITINEYNDIKKRVIESMNNNIDMISDYVNETIPLVEDIYSFMNRVPKILKK